MEMRPIIILLILCFVLTICSAASAADTNLTITQGSSGSVGGISKKTYEGPNQTVIQYHVTNNDLINTAQNVNTTFTWTSTNPYINLAPGQSNIVQLGNISAEQTIDSFYQVEFTRNKDAIGTSRNYQIVIAGNNTPTYTVTGTITVMELLSSNRNSITGITVSNNHPQVGDTITVTITSQTSSAGFPVISFPLRYNPAMLQPIGMVTTYIDAVGVPRTSKDVVIYNCYGNDFTTEYTILVRSANISTIYAMIMDLGGGKYHYNTNYGNYVVSTYVPASVGNLVWDDLNANGQYDMGEPGIPNVVVTLYSSTGTPLQTRTTDANGTFSFMELYPESYYLGFTLPSGYNFGPLFGSGYDNKANNITGITDIFTLSPGENDYTWNAGMYKNATVGHFVWNDPNANGIYEGSAPGLSGIANVTVSLYRSTGSLVGSTETDSSGYYFFNNLLPDSYFISFLLPEGYNFSPYNETTHNKANSTGGTATFNLISGQIDLTWDAAMYLNCTIGNLVWNDTNANGIQDSGEPGLSGVRVNLYNSITGDLVAFTTTDQDGNYEFTNVKPGDLSNREYYLEFIKPDGWNFSPAFQGTDNTIDSDVYPKTGKTPQIIPISGETLSNWDAGLYQNATMSGFVWMDLDLDGYYNTTTTPEEYPLKNIVVRLYNEIGIHLQSITTGPDGKYSFDNLVPGTYYLQFVAPVNYTISYYEQGVTRNTANSTGFTINTTLISNESETNWDAGMNGNELHYACLGDFVWEDLNADGIYDGLVAGLSGIANVTVNLYYENNMTTPIRSTTTNPNGYYRFNLLDPTEVNGPRYVLEFILPSGFIFSPYIEGVTHNKAQSQLNGLTAPINLTAGQVDIEWDAAMYRLGSIGNRVWEDLNGDGIQDQGEPGLFNVTVELYNSISDQLVNTTTTNSTGNYLFSDLTPGDYYVIVTKPDSSWKFSPQFQGTDDELDSDVYSNGKTPLITIISGQNQLNLDAGLYKYSTIGSLVWTDLNADGIKDENETGLSNVIVHLYSQAGTILDSAVTDTAGNFNFSSVPGSYYLEFILPSGYYISPNYGTGYNNTANSTGQTETFTVTSGSSQLNWNAGMWQTATIGDWVWNDQNADGIFNGRGWGLDNVTVELYKSSDIEHEINTTTTSNNGFYYFTNLVPGSYVVKFYTLPGFTFSPANQGTDPTINNKANPTTGFTDPIYVVSGENNLYILAAMYETVALGGFVWNDINDDGIFNSTESGMSNITVQLYYGLNNTYITNTTTNSTGNYTFENLIPNFYYVTFTKPDGYLFSPQFVGSNPAIYSSANRVTGETVSREYTSGVEYMYVNAGLFYGEEREANVTMTKTASTSTPNVGQEFNYTITITNHGPNNATNVCVCDNVPADFMIYVSSVVTQGSYNHTETELRWNVGTLANGSSATLNLTVKPKPNAAGMTIINIATSTQKETNPSIPSATVSVYVPAVDIQISNYPWQYNNVTKTYTDTYLCANTPVFVMQVKNSNLYDDANGVITEYIIGNGFEYVDCHTHGTGNTTYNSTSRTITWNIGFMPKGGEAFMKIFTRILTTGNKTTDLTNIARLKQVEEADINSTNNHSDCGIIVPSSADIEVTQTAQTYTANSKQYVSYIITVKNNGPDNATGLKITDKLPAGIEFSSDNSGGSYNNITGVWDIGTFNYGEPAKTLNITGEIIGTGTIKNTATRSSLDINDWNYNNNGQTTILTISGTYSPRVDIKIYHYPWYYKFDTQIEEDTYTYGDTPVFVMQAINSRSYDDANGVIMEYVLGDGFEYINCNTHGAGNTTYNSTSRTITWNIGFMPKGGIVFMKIFTRVLTTGNKTANLTNIARLKQVTENDINSANNEVSFSIISESSADIEVTQTQEIYTENENTYINYTITATNNGPGNATGLTISDPIPQNVEYVTHSTSNDDGATWNNNDPAYGTDPSNQDTYGIWNIGTLLSTDQPKKLKITVKITRPGTIKNTATKKSQTGHDWNKNNNGKTKIFTKS